MLPASRAAARLAAVVVAGLAGRRHVIVHSAGRSVHDGGAGATGVLQKRHEDFRNFAWRAACGRCPPKPLLCERFFTGDADLARTRPTGDWFVSTTPMSLMVGSTSHSRSFKMIRCACISFPRRIAHPALITATQDSNS
jgi:hypothetical protein